MSISTDPRASRCVNNRQQRTTGMEDTQQRAARDKQHLLQWKDVRCVPNANTMSQDVSLDQNSITSYCCARVQRNRQGQWIAQD